MHGIFSFEYYIPSNKVRYVNIELFREDSYHHGYLRAPSKDAIHEMVLKTWESVSQDLEINEEVSKWIKKTPV